MKILVFISALTSLIVMILLATSDKIQFNTYEMHEANPMEHYGDGLPPRRVLFGALRDA